MYNPEKDPNYIPPPEYYIAVKAAAKKLMEGKTGLASFSDKAAVIEFEKLSTAGIEDTEGDLKFIDAQGNVTENSQEAVAALVQEKDNPSAHLFYKDCFNQPVGK